MIKWPVLVYKEEKILFLIAQSRQVKVQGLRLGWVKANPGQKGIFQLADLRFEYYLGVVIEL